MKIQFWLLSILLLLPHTGEVLFGQETEDSDEKKTEAQIESEIPADIRTEPAIEKKHIYVHPDPNASDSKNEYKGKESTVKGKTLVWRDRKKEFGTDLQVALAMETSAIQSTPETRETLKGMYGKVIAADVSKPEERAIAQNNLANVLLKENTSDANRSALDLFETINVEYIPAEERFVFFYNHGRAVELADGRNRNRALALFLKSLEQNPLYKPAQDNAENILSSEPVSLPNSKLFIDRLNAAFDFDRSREFIWKQLNRSRGDESRELLHELAQNYTASRIPIKAFKQWEIDRLKVRAAGDPKLRALIGTLIFAFTVDVSPTSIMRNGHDFDCSDYHSESRWNDKEHSKLLQSIGDTLSNDGLIDRAFSRYVCAWDLDKENTESMIQAAGILQQNASIANRKLLDRFLDTIFSIKTQEYWKRSRDREALIRLHTILATIYESQNKWTGDGARNAVFQWEHAASNSIEIGKTENLPNIYSHLATCYGKAGDRNKAAEVFVSAADMLAKKDGNLKLAADMLSRAEGLFTPQILPEALAERSDLVRARIAQLKAERGY